MKRIMLLVKGNKDIRSAAMERSFSMAKDTLEDKISQTGVRIDNEFAPVTVKGRSTGFLMRTSALDVDYRTLNKPAGDANVYLVRGTVEDEKLLDKMMGSRGEVEAYADLKVEICPTPYCGRNPVGDHSIVREKLGIKDLGVTGKNTRIAIVDTGIKNGRREDIDINAKKGWAPGNVNVQPGNAPVNHGTMCAFDALISAPDAEILDYALLQSGGNTFDAFLSDGIAAFSSLIDEIQTDPRPLIVNNSWGLFNRKDDFPIGNPGNYSANPNHPFNQIAVSLVAAGADVLFAAGNCGENCPDGRCGTSDTGPGRSIHGAQGLPETITIAAITTDESRLGYSSQGPSGISSRKPDICSYSHFKGSGVYSADGGTSAACPVAAGVIAALRERFSNSQVIPDTFKGIIQKSAIDLNGNGWDYDIGYGLINPKGIWNLLNKTN
jgi:subtilisin family serine protease